MNWNHSTLLERERHSLHQGSSSIGDEESSMAGSSIDTEHDGLEMDGPGGYAAQRRTVVSSAGEEFGPVFCLDEHLYSLLLRSL